MTHFLLYKESVLVHKCHKIFTVHSRTCLTWLFCKSAQCDRLHCRRWVCSVACTKLVSLCGVVSRIVQLEPSLKLKSLYTPTHHHYRKLKFGIEIYFDWKTRARDKQLHNICSSSSNPYEYDTHRVGQKSI
jgi:hypothetical protein